MGLNQTRNNGDPADEEKVEPNWSLTQKKQDGYSQAGINMTPSGKTRQRKTPKHLEKECGARRDWREPNWKRWSKTEGGNVSSMAYVPKGIQRPNWLTKQKIYDSGRQFKSNLISSWRLFLDSGKKFNQKQCMWLKQLFNFCQMWPSHAAQPKTNIHFHFFSTYKMF